MVDQLEIVEEVQTEEENGSNEYLYYRGIRFNDGEEIICGILDNDLDYTIKKYITIHEPMCVERNGDLRNWSDISAQKKFEIQTSRISSVYPIKESVENRYDEVLQENYYAEMRELLKDPTLPDDEREMIMQELTEAYDGSEPIQEATEDPHDLAAMVVRSKMIH